MIVLTSYGDESGNHRGIVTLDIDTGELSCLRLNGKCNMVIQTEKGLIASIQEKEGNKLALFSNNGELVSERNCEYFYSYGKLDGDNLLLASFESGVDSVYSLKDKTFKHNRHKCKGSSGNGRSHYINRINGRIVSVDNAYQQLYVYADDTLGSYQTVNFENINIRLMAFPDSQREAYLNSEKSNEVIVLDTYNYEIKKRISLADSRSCASGIAASDSGNTIYICIRGENRLYAIDNTGVHLKIKCSVNTGDIPRDLFCCQGSIFVTCTGSNRVERYDMESLAFQEQFAIDRPVTFAIKN